MSVTTKPGILSNSGFEVIVREGAPGMMLRVYSDQSHFATCPNVRRRRNGGGK